MRKYTPVVILVLIGLFVLMNKSFFETKFAMAGFINSIFAKDTIDANELRSRIESLETENERLRGELLEQESSQIRGVKVYSSYPFNSRSEIAIAAGDDRQTKRGDTIIYKGNILVGRVRDVFEKSSVVTTIFDPSWQMTVRIGDSEVDALMKGGNELTLTLIPADSQIEEGDLVITSDKDFPYGLELGVISKIENKEGDIFKEAVLEPYLELKTLRDVAIYR